jgi:hypothetical protein
MRTDQRFKLIDFDASSRFVLDRDDMVNGMMKLSPVSEKASSYFSSAHLSVNTSILTSARCSLPTWQEFAGAKYSSLFLPPEMVYVNSKGEGVIRTYNRDAESGLPVAHEELPYELVSAHYSFDLWSLGVILYYLCVGTTLFQGTVEDNIFNPGDLVELANFDENSTYWRNKIELVTDNKARNLISLLLKRDPLTRLRTRRILLHPFLTNQPLRKPVVETNVFISYRVASDFKHAEAVYNKLTAAGVTVWWDRKGLDVGEDWEEGFVDALASSTIFLCLLSKNALFGCRKGGAHCHRIDTLTPDSPCDNVLLEWRMALELKEMGLLSKICPVFIGDEIEGVYDKYLSHKHPDLPGVAVSSIESKLRHHFQIQHLGLPYKTAVTVKELYASITKFQAASIEGSLEGSLDVIVNKVQIMLAKAINFKSMSSFRTYSAGSVSTLSSGAKEGGEREDGTYEEEKSVTTILAAKSLPPGHANAPRISVQTSRPFSPKSRSHESMPGLSPTRLSFTPPKSKLTIREDIDMDQFEQVVDQDLDCSSHSNSTLGTSNSNTKRPQAGPSTSISGQGTEKPLTVKPSSKGRPRRSMFNESFSASLDTADPPMSHAAHAQLLSCRSQSLRESSLSPKVSVPAPQEQTRWLRSLKRYTSTKSRAGQGAAAGVPPRRTSALLSQPRPKPFSPSAARDVDGIDFGIDSSTFSAGIAVAVATTAATTGVRFEICGDGNGGSVHDGIANRSASHPYRRTVNS